MLSCDTTLVELLKTSLEGRGRVWRADNPLHAADLLFTAEQGVLLVDAATATHETPALVNQLHSQFPELAIIVTGRRDDESELAQQISAGTVFRFLHKPVSAERARNFIEAAARRQGDKPLQLASSSSTRLPRLQLPEVDLQKVAAALPQEYLSRLRPIAGRTIGTLALLVAVVGLLTWRPWKIEPAIDTAGRAALGAHSETARLLDAAGLALSQGRLSAPPGRNAVELYAAALAHEPGNAEARKGLARTADALLARTERALLERDLPAAEAAVAAARRAEPSHPRLAFLEVQVAREHSRAVAAPPGVTPAAAAPPTVEQQVISQTIRQLLATAATRRKQGRLTGDGDTAVTALRTALDLRPDDPAVLLAAESLNSEFLNRASAALDVRDFAAAAGWLDAAERLGVQRDATARLRGELTASRVSLQREDRVRLLALANQRIAQGRLVAPTADSARHYLDLLRAADPDFDGLAETSALLASHLLDESRRLAAAGQFPAARELLDEASAAGAPAADVAVVAAELSAARARVAAQTAVPESQLVRIEHAAPAYPSRAQSQGIGGWVDLEFTVTADGTTRDATIRGASPAGVFEKSVLEAVRKWRYQPLLGDGGPVEQRVALRLSFTVIDR